MSARMVLRMKARRVEEVVRGRRGKRDLRSLWARGGVRYWMTRDWRGTHSMDVMTFLFRSMTRFVTRFFRVSGASTA
jgi:hypothetical protein